MTGHVRHSLAAIHKKHGSWKLQSVYGTEVAPEVVLLTTAVVVAFAASDTPCTPL